MGDGSLRNTGPNTIVRDSGLTTPHDTQPIEKKDLLAVQRDRVVEEMLRRKIREMVTDQLGSNVSEANIEAAINFFDGHQKEKLRLKILKENKTALDLLAEMHLEKQVLINKAELNPITSLAKEERAAKIFESYKDSENFLGPDRVMVVVGFDLDGFKAINDKLGHAAGNKALKLVGDQLSKALLKIRRTDLTIHFHGDEFGLLLSGVKAAKKKDGTKMTIEETVEEVIDRYISAIEEIEFPQGLALSASAGFKIVTPDNLADNDFNSFYKAADRSSKIAKMCKFVPNYQSGSSRIANADQSEAQFLEKRGISKFELHNSYARGVLARPISDLFHGEDDETIKEHVEGIVQSYLKKQGLI